MGLEIAKISDVALQSLATEKDENNNGKLEKEEYNLFQKAAQDMLEKGEVKEENYMQAVKQYHSGFIGWFRDDSMVCKDTKDDGKIGVAQALLNTAQGFAGGIVKGVAQNPIKSAIGIAAGVGLTVLTGGAILPIMVGAGLIAGGAITVKGAVDASTATTDADKKKAFENVGTGASVAVLSALGIKSANKAAANAGVKSLQGLENESLLANVKAGIKATPEIIKQSGLNTKGNALTWTSAIKGDNVIYANSNKLRSMTTYDYMSKPNDVEAYRFNPNGTPEEILANNPHVEQLNNGKFGVVDKWATQDLQAAMSKGLSEAEAAESLGLDATKVSGGKVFHLIDADKNPMVMIYNEAEGDFAICEGNVFKGSYVDQAAFKADGTLNYQDPKTLAYGQRISATKQAPGGFTTEAPVGTKVQTVSEGTQTVTEGKVIALDHEGNPYVTPIENITKRNNGISTQGLKAIYEQKPMALAKSVEGQNYLIANDPATYLKSQGVKITGTDLFDCGPHGDYTGTIFNWTHNGTVMNPIKVGDYCEPLTTLKFAQTVHDLLSK